MHCFTHPRRRSEGFFARHPYLVLPASALAIILTGCVAKVHDGPVSMTHVVIGFGIVKTPKMPDAAITTTDVQAAGMMISDSPSTRFLLGGGCSTVTMIDANANATLEVTRKPWGPLKIRTGEAQFAEELSVAANQSKGANP